MLNKKMIVAIEGNPGSGKTLVKDTLQINNIKIDRIDQILPNNEDSDKDLVSSDIVASDLLKSAICQKAQNKIVILDRYIHSTLAYQYAYDKVNKTSDYDQLLAIYKKLESINYLIKPDITIYIDTPYELSISRKARQPGTSPWTDKEFLNSMRNYYKNTDGIDHVIDGKQQFNDVLNEITTIIKGGLR